jgi:glycosyltransferase involved in cell wall biosynthesis
MKYSNTEPLVSIIMNCYNGDQYLRHAISSVLTQSYQNWEIIFWDNQSIDNSRDIFQSYCDPRFHYFFADQHTSLGAARNYAIKECRGDLIAFLDVDDWWVPKKLELQVPLFNKSTVGMSCGNFFFSNERKGNKTSTKCAYQRLPNGYVLNELLEDFFVHFSNLVIRKSALLELPYLFDLRFNIIEDYDLVARLSVQWEMASVQTPISYYRWHPKNTGYKTEFLIGEELKIWYDELKENELFRSQENFKKLKLKAKYYEVVRLLYIGKRKEALQCIGDITHSQQLRVLVGVLMPTPLLRKWLDR